MPTPVSPLSPPPARIGGLDLARALAVFGMVGVNLPLALGQHEGMAGALSGTLSGRAAAVFVVLAGVGLSLAGRRAPTHQALRRTLARRSLGLGAFGLLWMPLWPADILHYYAVWLMLGAWALSWSSARLLQAAALAVGGFVLLYGGLDYEARWDRDTLHYEGFWTPVGFVRHLLFDGFHPVLPWVAFLFLGMWLGRHDLRSSSVRRGLLVRFIALGGVVEGVAWVLEMVAVQRGWEAEVAHQVLGVSPMPPLPTYMLGAGSLAAAVVVALIPVAARWLAPSRPLRVVGRHALSHYVGHVLFLVVPLYAVQEELGPLPPEAVVGAVGAYGLLGTAASVMWDRHARQGPLETLLRRWTAGPPDPGPRPVGTVASPAPRARVRGTTQRHGVD